MTALNLVGAAPQTWQLWVVEIDRGHVAGPYI